MVSRDTLLESEVCMGGRVDGGVAGRVVVFARAEEGGLAGPLKYAPVRPTGLLCT